MRLQGTARVDRKTKDLIKRLRPGDIAVIDHSDLDEVAARSLLEARIKAVINAQPFSTGRYPNLGPQLLAKCGVMLLDSAGPEVMERIKEGEQIRIVDSRIESQGGELLAEGTVLTESMIRRQLADAQSNLISLAEEFIDNTLEFAQREKGFVLGDVEFPPLEAQVQGRHVVVVVRGRNYRADLFTLRSYIAEVKPVLIGVDGGADALLEMGRKPDLIVGDMDSISDNALQSGAEILVHAYPDGRAPGLRRVQELGLEAKIVAAPGTSEDIALLLAYELGAALIVAVGTHSSMMDFLEKGRPGMASTFLVRLKVGSVLVDARGVSELYKTRPGRRHLLQLLIAAALPLVLLLLMSSPMRQVLRLILLQVRLAWRW
ncbi:MAG: hypothetical protein GX341_09795 [Firmicutes bacterium]|jgi:uncharacterized membrane-anchored protein|nr:hypothetical protein [Bacillota bacterium]